MRAKSFSLLFDDKNKNVQAKNNDLESRKHLAVSQEAFFFDSSSSMKVAPDLGLPTASSVSRTPESLLVTLKRRSLSLMGRSLLLASLSSLLTGLARHSLRPPMVINSIRVNSWMEFEEIIFSLVVYSLVFKSICFDWLSYFLLLTSLIFLGAGWSYSPQDSLWFDVGSYCPECEIHLGL